MIRSSVLTTLVKGWRGLESEAVLKSTLTSDCNDELTSGNVPFVVMCHAVPAWMDMWVGYASLVKLCRFIEMKPLTFTSFMMHIHAICELNKVVLTGMLNNATATDYAGREV